MLVVETQEIDSTICDVCRLLQPWEQVLPGRRHYTNGLKCLERRIHSMIRLKLYSKIKVDTDSQFDKVRSYGDASKYIPGNRIIRDQKTEKKKRGSRLSEPSSSAVQNSCANFSTVGCLYNCILFSSASQTAKSSTCTSRQVFL